MPFISRIVLFFMLTQIIAACKSLKEMLPEGPVLSYKERIVLQNLKAHAIQYTADAKVDFLIAPVQVWAATYDLDIILVSEHPDWNMHEFAKISTPEGPVWLMKDAQEGTLDQFVTADIEDIHTWLPELPVQRKAFPVKVKDRSTAKMLDLEFEYNNHEGTLIKATYQGKHPVSKMKKRNGSTMGHSRNQLLVGLDLPYRDFGKKSSISYDGKAYKMQRLLGLVPFHMALQQTQAGLSSGQFAFESKSDKLESFHEHNAEKVNQLWLQKSQDSLLCLEQKNDFRTIRYYFAQKPRCGLQFAEVQQWNKKGQALKISFYPELPDMRRPFEGSFVSTFVLDVGTARNNALGKIKAYWKNGKAVLEVLPEQPWWVKDRPMKTIINYGQNKAFFDIQMQDITK